MRCWLKIKLFQNFFAGNIQFYLNGNSLLKILDDCQSNTFDGQLENVCEEFQHARIASRRKDDTA